ncbi:MAG: hypothetical protein MI861_09205, partial [Pirellulales bacterium]|nr:hypothetical protein [Pirellulales bacterium]
MTNQSPESNQPAGRGDEGHDSQRRLLELELLQVRREAAAAKLDARAAEIELMIRRLAASSSGEASQIGPPNAPHFSTSNTTPSEVSKASRRFESWDEVRAALPQQPASQQRDLTEERPAEQGAEAGDRVQSLRVDSRHRGPAPAHLDVSTEATLQLPLEADRSTEDSVPIPRRTESPHTSQTDNVDASAVALKESEDDSEHQRPRPAAWLVSAVVHGVVFLLLALVTLQSRPKDQVALSASAAQANEVSMETFTIESSEPEVEPNEPTETSEAELELSPLGEIHVTKFTPPAPISSASDSLSQSLSPAEAVSLDLSSDAKIQFCGVEGGGNHFVYLVDSSGSMGNGFESAREELLRSIDQLQPEQRFYVVFFDAQPDFMRLTNSNEDEPRSVHATAENKAAMKRWARSITIDRGKAPYEALRFALQLRPDAVFLLSDGEFPQGIEDLLKNENKVENLFGDRKPISIVHTISYHSKEGESRMRRIAQQNGGQYRHI